MPESNIKWKVYKWYYEKDCGKLRESILVVRDECRRGKWLCGIGLGEGRAGQWWEWVRKILQLRVGEEHICLPMQICNEYSQVRSWVWCHDEPSLEHADSGHLQRRLMPPSSCSKTSTHDRQSASAASVPMYSMCVPATVLSSLYAPFKSFLTTRGRGFDQPWLSIGRRRMHAGASNQVSWTSMHAQKSAADEIDTYVHTYIHEQYLYSI